MTKIPIDRRHGGTAPDDRDTLDFSVSVAPLGPPAVAVEAHRRASLALERYPDPEARRLRDALARRHRVDPASVLVAAGSTAVFTLLARALEATRPVVVIPTFSEIANALALVGRPAAGIALRAPDFAWPAEEIGRALDGGADAIFFGRPNSPTGTLVERARAEALADECETRRVACVIDEAFVDFAGETESLVERAARSERLVVVRSLTKIFAIPALRVGYAVAPADLVARLASLREPWSVSAPAEEVALACLAVETSHVARTRAVVEHERARITGAVAAAGCRVHPSVANFVLVEDPSRSLVGELAGERIRVRDLASMPGLGPGFLRIGVRSPSDVDRLVAALGRLARIRTRSARGAMRGA